MRQWAWRTLQAARDEFTLAVESVMEDLEGLGACGGAGGVSAESAPARSPGAVPSGHGFEDDCSDDGGGGGGVEQEEDDDEDDPGLRVDDLVASTPVRAAYEQETPCAASEAYDDDFEIIDFEEAAGITAHR